jgi:glycine C-acetyltransferase
MATAFPARLQQMLQDSKKARSFKEAEVLQSQQATHVKIDKRDILMLSSNNYLGLASHPKLKEAGKKAIEEWGCGAASVRFICGTLDIHLELERKIAQFLGVEDSLLYVSCSAANEGLIPTLIQKEDEIFSDELNHASIIDGIRLCRGTKYIYKHRDMDDLKRCLDESKGSGIRMIVTDGVFSMEGDYPPLPELTKLAQEYDAFIVVDESHATGFVGEHGRGTAEKFGLPMDITIQTGTLGKALGGACGGYVAGPKDLINVLKAKSRPYIFSNALPPAMIFIAMAAIDLIQSDPSFRERVLDNTRYFRDKIGGLGLAVLPGDHPIVPIIIGETEDAIRMSEELLDEGVYVSGFGFPIVPKGEARLRAQISAAHTREDLDFAVKAIETVSKRLGLI